MGLLRGAGMLAVALVLGSLALNLAMDGRVRMHWPQPRFSLADMPDLSGQVALVTGAASGTGLATSVALARSGARVYVGCRSVAKARAAAAEVAAATGRADADVVALDVALDLTSLAQVAAFAKALSKAEPRLHMLVNNAGIMFTDFALTEDGIEEQFAVNHVAHHALTLALLPQLEAAAPARVVTVSSVGHFNTYPAGVHLASLNSSAAYNSVLAYGQSKLANILFTRELSRRIAGRGVYVNAAHPGYVATKLQRSINAYLEGIFGRLVPWTNAAFAGVFALSRDEGALTQIYLAASSQVVEKNISGQYYVPTARRAGDDWTALSLGMSKHAVDDALAADVWRFTAKVTGLGLAPL